MKSIHTIIDRLRSNPTLPSLFWNGREYSNHETCNAIDKWLEIIKIYNIKPGTICGVLGEFSPNTTSLFFALMLSKAIIVPFTYAAEKERQEAINVAGVQCLFKFDPDDNYNFDWLPVLTEKNQLIQEFLKQESSGLIVFSSGSSGRPKGILQDCEKVMHKFVSLRPGWRTILFLLMDHFGGFNTFLSCFAYHGLGICIKDRSPQEVCRVIQEGKATLLPTTPTFLNLLIASGSYRAFDLSSIQLITYGTEVMSEATLFKVKEIFPNAQIKQTYGLSEVGVLRSRSKSDASVWLKIGGDGFEVKVVDSILWIRSEANMVGYLNAPQPFDEEGWLCTGDQVEVKGEYYRILGRKSEMINVGGQKVFPVEVETILLEDPNIQEATVFGVPHPLMGQVAHARVSLHQPETMETLTNRLRRLCLDRLTKYKVPLKFIVIDKEVQHSERFKKLRQ